MTSATATAAAKSPLEGLISPLDAEMIRHTLISIPNLIETNITRTAYSPLIYELKDYAVGIVDHEGSLVAQAEGGIPLFLANAIGVAVQDGLAVHGREGIYDGDVFISNHSGTIGQHLNNVAMYTPIFTGSDKADLIGFMAVIVHWLDIGGKEIGSGPPTGTTEIFQEGLHFRSVKLWERGRPSRDIYSIVELSSRFPHMLMGDIDAQVAGCLLGRDMVVKMVDRYSPSKVRAGIKRMFERSEAAARSAVAAIPDGLYEASSQLDNDGLRLDRPVQVHAKIHVDGDQMMIDLSGVGDQVGGSINSGRNGGAVTAARIAFKYLTAPDEAVNEGSFRPLKVEIPDGTFLSAGPTAAMAMYSGPLATVVDTILKAMAPAAPDRVPAGHHATHGIFAISGRNPKTGQTFYNPAGSSGGWGACNNADGSGPYRTMTHGDTHDVPAEVQEALYPIRILRHEIVTDSGGAGEYRGGLGVERELLMLAPVFVQINFDRLTCPPWGVEGGRDGLPARVVVERSGGEDCEFPKGAIHLKPLDRVVVRTAGGGGFGDPRRRGAEALAADIAGGYVSPEAARRIYGAAPPLEP